MHEIGIFVKDTPVCHEIAGCVCLMAKQLEQYQDNQKLHPVAYASRSVSIAEAKHAITDLVLCGQSHTSDIIFMAITLLTIQALEPF